MNHNGKKGKKVSKKNMVVSPYAGRNPHHRKTSMVENLKTKGLKVKNKRCFKLYTEVQNLKTKRLKVKKAVLNLTLLFCQ